VIQCVGRVALESETMNEEPREFDVAAGIAEMTEMIVGQIRKPAELREEGILTEEEFASKKQELLSRL